MTIRFSEAQFRTVKYRPEFPKRFGALEHARAHPATTSWLGTMTPTTTAASAISRRPTCITAARRRFSTWRHRTRRVAYAAHPERFVSGPPRPETLPTRRMDQSAVRNDPPGCPRTDDRHPGRLPACGRCPAATAARSVVVAPRRWRGVATVNAELGCLKDVDTARYSPVCRLCSYVSTGSMGQVRCNVRLASH